MSLTEIGLEVVHTVALVFSWETALFLTIFLILAIVIPGVPPIALWGAGGALAVAIFTRIVTTRCLSRIERQPHRFSGLPRSAKWTIAVFVVVFAVIALAAITVYAITVYLIA